MKKTNFYFVLSLVLAVTSCKKEPIEPTLKTAQLSINIGVKVHELDVYKIRKSALAIEDYKVIIEDDGGKLIEEFERAADLPDVVELAPGTYRVTAHSNNLVDAAFESPYYFGQSEDIVLTDGDNQDISITCTLGNCAVTVTYSENIVNHFDNYSTNVSNSGGALIFNETESRTGYFSLNPLSIAATLSFTRADNSTGTKTLSGSIEVPEAQKLYAIFLDALPDQTGISVSLIEDGSISSQQIVLTDGSSAREPVVGDLIISEIMANPDALPDNEGEYVEVYNTSTDVLALNGLIFKENGSTAFTIDQDIFITPNGYITIAVSGNVSFGPDFITSGLSLTNSGETLGLYYIINTAETELFSINYGGTDFPTVAGASIELSRNHLNSTDAVTGTNWCIAVSDMGNGDLGTPGTVNDCN